MDVFSCDEDRENNTPNRDDDAPNKLFTGIFSQILALLCTCHGSRGICIAKYTFRMKATKGEDDDAQIWFDQRQDTVYLLDMHHKFGPIADRFMDVRHLAMKMEEM